MDILNSPYENCASQVGLACRLGNLEYLNQLLESGAKCDVPDNRGWFPLHEASFSGHQQCLTAIFKSKQVNEIDINCRSHDGTTPLLLASQRCYILTVELLCHFGADTNITSLDGISPLFAVSEKQDKDVVRIMKILINNGANIGATYFNGWTSLHNAAAASNIDAVNLLLSKGANPCCKDLENITPLFLAVQYGALKCFNALIQAAQDKTALVNLASKDNVTCVYICAQEGYDNILRLLIEFGADCNRETSDKMLPIIPAIKSGFNRCLKLLIAQTSTEIINSMPDDPILVAVESRSIECLKLLISNGFDVNRVITNDSFRFPTPIYRYLGPLLAKNCCTSLARAVVLNSVEMVKILLFGGANPHFTDSTILSPFLLAILKRKYPLILKSFLEYGVDLNISTEGSLSMTFDPMLIAIHPIYRCQLIELLKAGLKPNLNNWCGCNSPNFSQTKYSFAEEIAQLLTASDMARLLNLVLSFCKIIPRCCNFWRDENLWRCANLEKVTDYPVSLKNLCRLTVRDCMDTKQLYNNSWHETLPLPPNLRAFVSFQNELWDIE